jgi:hypothetical protein
MQSKRLTKAKKAGRPPTLTMPEPIDDTIDNVMDAVLSTPPKKRGEWKYLQQRQAGDKRDMQVACNQEGSS